MQKLHVCHADGCGMKFPTALLLQKHQRNVHGQQQPTQHLLSPQQSVLTPQFNSSVSESKFAQSHNGHSVTTVKHDTTQISMQNGQNAVVALDPSSQGAKSRVPFVPEEQQNMVECEECGKHVRETSLAAHKKRHELAAKRPFKCEICGKVFLLTKTNVDSWLLGLYANCHAAGSHEHAQWSEASQMQSLRPWLGVKVRL